MFIDEFYINSLIGFLVGILLFGLYFWFYDQKQRERLGKKHHESRALAQELSHKDQELQKLRLELTTYKERIAQSENSKLQMRQEFENIAHQILTQSSNTLSKQNHHYLDALMKPFKDDIKSFHDRIEDYYFDESKERFSLTKEIQNLQALNQQISQDALNLTDALKGNNKIQGDWGEMVLERLLEGSGLKNGREYSIQKSLKNDKKELFRPDVIIHLPKNRDVIIDSKVSLKSYEAYYHDRSKEAKHAKEFLDSLKRHITMLSDKSYQNLEGIQSLDFVLMFIPIDAALLLAQELDKQLLHYAYQKNVILVSPSTLMAVLRIIENGWRFEYQNKNAQLIAKKAGDLYDKFYNFIQEMQKIDSSLKRAQEAYDDAFKKLSTGKGNLMTKSQELKSLEGVGSKHKLKERE